MSKKIAIVGLGASGCFAAKAARDMGCEVDIFATYSSTSMPPGATWLHWIPDDLKLSYKPTPIYVLGKGGEKGYIERQWGDLKTFVPGSSFPKEPVWEHGYNPAKVMEDLVPVDCDVQMIPYPMSDADIKDLAPSYDLVFQTFATKADKEFQPPLISYMAAAKFGCENPDKNFVVYNGLRDSSLIVREAQLFGNHFFEFPKGMSQEHVLRDWPMDMEGYKVVMLKDLDPRTKPVQQPKGKIKLLGRWAQWDRKILSHDAYAIVQKMIQEHTNANPQ